MLCRTDFCTPLCYIIESKKLPNSVIVARSELSPLSLEDSAAKYPIKMSILRQISQEKHKLFQIYKA